MTDERPMTEDSLSPEASASGDGLADEVTDGEVTDGGATPDGEVTDGEVADEEPSGELTLEAALSERDDYLDQLRRISAEFANYKKRMAREQLSITERATERLVKELLPVHDDLERALEAFAAHDEAQVAKGVELVHRSLTAVLGREGVVAIEPDGEAFDPHRHEALLSQPSEAPEGTVIQVVQKGFQLGDRVVRPARVVVSAPKS